MSSNKRKYNDVYTGDRLSKIAFPLGGIGAGMICLEGCGALSHFSIRNRPDVFNEPIVFSAISVKTESGKNVARVLEGPVPRWKVFGRPRAGRGCPGTHLGLPRFSTASFRARFPFANLELRTTDLPVRVAITGWSPFIPGDPDNSSLPVAALEYRFSNVSGEPLEMSYSFNAMNFMSTGSGGEAVLSTPGGFILWQPGSQDKPWEEGAFCAMINEKDARTNCAWFRGRFFDSLSMAWRSIEEGNCPARSPVTEGPPSPGGSVCLPMRLYPGEERTVRLQLSWYVPETDLSYGEEPDCAGGSSADCCASTGGAAGEETLVTHKPWYSGRFGGIENLIQYWRDNYESLRQQSLHFSDCFYDTTLPPEVIEAVAANLTILKSPTVLRQTDGRLWCWEGCRDQEGCCGGSCTHVWNYAQALPHLFPSLERSLRETEFNESQDNRGHQNFRSALPIRPTAHDRPAAADGQLGGIMKIYREWRISGDTQWLREIWPKMKASLDYCIRTWDPRHTGVLEEPHHNTYDVEFWGPDGMCTTFYLGALKAAAVMGTLLGHDVSMYETLFRAGRDYLEEDLYNGEYFYQSVRWRGLESASPIELASGTKYEYSAEAVELFAEEGPKYQYGIGCMSDGVIGAWLAGVCGLERFLDPEKLESHLRSVYKHNLKGDLSEHVNPERPCYALGCEGGLVLCTWPRGGRPSLPFVYSDEVWTGTEYQVASHLLSMGLVDEGLEIVRTCRDRYDGTLRNPFNEYECGHWYGRAMASYALLQGLTGVRYDSVEKVLYIEPALDGDFRSFFCTDGGYGTVGVEDGAPFFHLQRGDVEIQRLE